MTTWTRARAMAAALDEIDGGDIPQGSSNNPTAAAGSPSPSIASPLELVPLKYDQAAAFVDGHHRHHRRPVGHKWSTGVIADGVLVGVAMVGRPVSRHLDDGRTLEVNRTCTDGHPNANSMLYGAAWRAAKAMGYRRLVTYTQADESGASLRAAGWRIVAELPPRSGWWTPSRPRDDRGTDGVARTLWEAS